MAIKPHPTPAPAFNLENKFPVLPKLSRLSDEDTAALEQWYEDFLNVLTRQFTTVTTAIDKKADKT